MPFNILGLITDPVKRFQVNGVVTPVQSVPVVLGIGNDQTVLAAITGKRIRVMGWIIQSTSTAVTSQVALKNGAAGAGFISLGIPCYSVGSERQPIVDSGYFETSTGIALVADVVGNQSYITVFYLPYTP